MLELEGSIWFRSGSQTWGGAERIELLRQIELTGSITAAARAAGVSYKGAWDSVEAMNNLAGEPLVTRVAGGKGGGGTQLTPRARQLIRTFDALAAAHGEFITRLGEIDPRPEDTLQLMRQFMLKTSARNTLSGQVQSIREGAVNDEVVLTVQGGHTIVASITRASVQSLGLTKGSPAIALIKASSVLVGLPGTGMRISARNQLSGTIVSVTPGAVNAEVVIGLTQGLTLTAIITNQSVVDLQLEQGKPAIALFKASSVIVGVLD